MHHSPVGVVIVGRNEGDRLVCCIKRVQRSKERVVYVDVDSASSDDSAILLDSGAPQRRGHHVPFVQYWT
jgi:GT2 family glycosyltransferase